MTRTKLAPALCILTATVATALLVGAGASNADVRSRSGTIAFLRTVGAGPSHLFAIEADGSGLRRLTPSGLDVASFEWAPDGSRIAYLDASGALRLVRPDGTGRQRLATSSLLRSPWFLSWSPDGKAIAVDARDPAVRPLTRQTNGLHLRIVVVPADGGASRRLPSGDAQYLDWSPQGDEIAYGWSGRDRIIGTDGSRARPFFPSPQKLGLGCRRGRPTERTSGESAAGFRAGAASHATPGSMSQTQTAATFTSSRAMRTTSTDSLGLPTGGAFSMEGRTAKAFTSSAQTDGTTAG